MNTMPTAFRRLIPTLAVTALLAAPADLVAQDEVAIDTSPQEPLLLSIDFAGGPVTEFVAALRSAAEALGRKTAPLNLLVAKDSSTVQVPPLRIRFAELGDIVRAASTMLAPRHCLEVEVINGGNGMPIHVVRDINAEQFDTTPRLRVLPLRALTQTVDGESSNLALSPETILTAVQTALDLDAENTAPATVRFHESSGLLFVRGSERQIEAASEVVAQMQSDLESLRERERAMREAAAAIRNPFGTDAPPGGSGR